MAAISRNPCLGVVVMVFEACEAVPMVALVAAVVVWTPSLEVAAVLPAVLAAAECAGQVKQLPRMAQRPARPSGGLHEQLQDAGEPLGIPSRRRPPKHDGDPPSGSPSKAQAEKWTSAAPA
jgi:hypothetical protein